MKPHQKLAANRQASVLISSVVAIATFGMANNTQAASITLGSLTFSEYTAGFTITGGTAGNGSQADPFIIYEDIFTDDVTLKIEGLPTFGKNPTGSGHTTGFWLRKVVTNSTGKSWNFFDHELQETFGIASANGDGLSFGQGFAAGRPFTSDQFDQVNEIIDPRDFVNFSEGIVKPGETVIFNYLITDNSPISQFYLRQRPNFNPNPVPEPSAILGLFGLGLFGLLCRLRPA